MRGDGLTMFRIGGPSPEARDGVEVVHLSWEEAAAGYLGFTSMVEYEKGAMAPVFLKPDRNIARDAVELGLGPFGAKWPVRTTGSVFENAIDGDSSTAFEEQIVIENRDWPVFGIEFAGLLPVNRIVFYPTTANPDHFPEFYELFGWAGDKVKLVNPWNEFDYTYDLLDEAERNRVSHVEVTMPTQLFHTLILVINREITRDNNAYSTADQPWEIAEFEIYGDGYAPVAEYHTRILDLGATSSLGEIRWQGDKARDARVQIRTRSGADEDPLRYWILTGRGDEISSSDAAGNPLTRAHYDKLSPVRKGGVTHDVDNWSFWSAPYSFADSTGTSFKSTGPHQFAQLQIDFASVAQAGGELGYLEFEASSPPVVRDVVGEVSPVVAVAGEETRFVYAFRPNFTPVEVGEGESGFDRFLLSTPGELSRVDSVRVNEDIVPCELVINAALTPCEQLGEPRPRRECVLPRLDVMDSGKIVEVFFRARIYRFGTVFDGLLLDSERPNEVGQSVTGGDATFLLESNQLSVGVDLSGNLLQDVGVSSPVLTPNGDGVNDGVEFHYSLLQLASDQSVTIDVFNLNGQRVRRVYEGMETSGRQQRRWDGRGENGPLAPGLYIYRIAVDADAREAERNGVISVVY